MNKLEKLKECFYGVVPDGWEPREGQLEKCAEIVDHFDSGAKHVILEAPTGSGKSIVAMTVAASLAKTEEDKVCITTITKSIQDQYLKDFKDLNDIRSSSTEIYRCSSNLVRKDVDCKIESKKKKCDNKFDCPYKRAINIFRGCPLKITNLAFALNIPSIFATVCIIDESHKLPDTVAGQIEFKIQEMNSTYVKLVLKHNSNEFIESWEKFVSYLSEQEEKESFTLEDRKDFRRAHTLVSKKLEEFNYDEIVGNDILKKAVSHCRGLKSTLDTVALAVGTPMIKYEDLVFKPIYASTYTKKVLFSKAKKFLHMSATICDFEAYCEEVGIDEDEARFVLSDHVIPAERREVEFLPAAWMSFKNYEKDLEKTIKFVDDLIKQHDNKNTILHTVSYQRAEDISKDSEFDIQVPRNHKEVVDLLRSRSSGIVVASPSIVAGIDAKDDMCRLNIICKIPFPSFGDPRIKYISRDSPRLFNMQIIRDIVQACGRSTRHEEDYSWTYIIDGNFKRIYNDYGNLFPSWFKDSLKM